MDQCWFSIGDNVNVFLNAVRKFIFLIFGKYIRKIIYAHLRSFVKMRQMGIDHCFTSGFVAYESVASDFEDFSTIKKNLTDKKGTFADCDTSVGHRIKIF